MSSPKVFISYSRDDREFVEKLVRSLEQAEIEPWYDYELLSGQDWDDALEEQILNCDHMIIVLSETSVASSNVKNEMRFAMDHGKHIHPVYYKPCSVPLSMRRMHYVDFIKLGYDAGIDRLSADIRQRAGMAVKTKTAETGKKNKSKAKGFVIGIVTLLAIVVAIWQFWPDDRGAGDATIGTPDPEDSTDIKTAVTDLNWQKVRGSTKMIDYLDYINDFENEEQRLPDAIRSVQGFLTDKGSVIISESEYSNWFQKLVYKDVNGDCQVYDPLNPNTDWPLEGDLLQVRKTINVIDPQTADVMGGVRLEPGELIQYSSVSDMGNQKLIVFYFKDSEEPEFDNSGSEGIVFKDQYISKFEYKKKIHPDMTEAEIWEFLTTQNTADEFEGMLWYLEHYGLFEGRFSSQAIERFSSFLDKEGYVIHKTLSAPEPYFKSILRYDNETQRMWLEENDLPVGGLHYIICTNPHGSPVYRGVYGRDENHDGVGYSIRQGEIAIVSPIDGIINANQRQYLKVRYREY